MLTTIFLFRQVAGVIPVAPRIYIEGVGWLQLRNGRAVFSLRTNLFKPVSILKGQAIFVNRGVVVARAKLHRVVIARLLQTLVTYKSSLHIDRHTASTY